MRFLRTLHRWFVLLALLAAADGALAQRIATDGAADNTVWYE